MAPRTGSHHFDKRADQLIAAGQGDDTEILTANQVAMWLGVSPLWLTNGRGQGFGPKFIHVGSRTIVYMRKDVLEFLEERKFQSVKDYKKQAKALKAKAARDVKACRNRDSRYRLVKVG